MTPALPETRGCEVCGTDRLAQALDLGPHPMCDDLVPVGDPRQCREYPIEILVCGTCLTAHQRFQVPKRELFPKTYHYRSRFTADVLAGMAELVASSERAFGPLAGKRVLDVGCNDGSLLDHFRARGARTVGIEPTDAFHDAQAKGHATFNDFLSVELADAVVAAHGHPDVIIFTNVFAHIEDLPQVIAALRRLMAPRTIIVIENHYLGAVLDKNQFDTFYHEHARTYSYTSFVHIARSLDVPVRKVDFPSRYGGNIRVFLGGSTEAPAALELEQLGARERRFPEDFATLRANIERWRDAKTRYIREQVRRSGPFRAKAFPGRAAILVKLLDLDESAISAVFEKPGSLKIGHYVPGTRIPIRSDDELFAMPDQGQPLLNLAWHIPEEIRGYLAAHGYTGQVIDIVDSGDFATRP